MTITLFPGNHPADWKGDERGDVLISIGDITLSLEDEARGGETPPGGIELGENSRGACPDSSRLQRMG